MTDWSEWFLREVAARPVSLSEAGTARRAEILRSFEAAASARGIARGRRRVAVRVGAGALVTALTALACMLLPSAGRGSPCRIEIVRDDPGVLVRLAAPPAPIPEETWVDDDQLISLLASSDRTTGLIRSGARVILTAHVTDDL